MLLGIVNDVMFEQPENALSPNVFTVFGIEMDVKDEHLENALLPMAVTLFGIVIEDSF